MPKIVEIFNSIEGEGKRSGDLVTFIRLAGCNLRCSYCDTTYSYDTDNAKELTIAEIMEQVTYNKVTVTGGEPLYHSNIVHLLEALLKNQHEVNIETNGSIDLARTSFLKAYPGKLFYTMDFKLPSSGMYNEMYMPNLRQLRKDDVLKFVVGSEEDLEKAWQILDTNLITAKVYISPVFGSIEPAKIVKYMQDNTMTDCTLQLQMHKIIWSPETRGV